MKKQQLIKLAKTIQFKNDILQSINSIEKQLNYLYASSVLDLKNINLEQTAREQTIFLIKNSEEVAENEIKNILIELHIKNVTAVYSEVFSDDKVKNTVKVA